MEYALKHDELVRRACNQARPWTLENSIHPLSGNDIQDAIPTTVICGLGRDSESLYGTEGSD